MAKIKKMNVHGIRAAKASGRSNPKNRTRPQRLTNKCTSGLVMNTSYFELPLAQYSPLTGANKTNRHKSQAAAVSESRFRTW